MSAHSGTFSKPASRRRARPRNDGVSASRTTCANTHRESLARATQGARQAHLHDDRVESLHERDRFAKRRAGRQHVINDGDARALAERAAAHAQVAPAREHLLVVLLRRALIAREAAARDVAPRRRFGSYT